ncbi:hypothetical protein [Roseibium aggregatum]|uniref:Peptidoglycan binding protein n=1 Tax=Roseibium aggregatum TaxID=187304 RepID=A0A939EFH7_9HYPH|nr:hypothetical protein [Roseibium aggregatum]MBN9672033.1 hypothetical protein [Roseibium aggregatum]
MFIGISIPLSRRLVGGTVLALGALFLSLGAGSVAEAAEIRLLDRNPAAGPGYELLDLGTVTEQAYLHATGLEDGFTSKAEVKGSSLAYFENGIAGDGAHTYETLHIVPAWGGLKTGRVISIEGQIEKGDLEKLKTLVETASFSECLKPGYCPYNNIIMLNSPGGSLREGLELGKYIASQNFITLLPENAICESACSLVFLGGYTRYEGFFFPRRFAHETARLGIHQPFIQLPEGNYRSAEVNQVVRTINQGFIEVTDYLIDTGIGIGFLRNMYKTKPTSMYRLSVSELAAENIFVVGRPSQLTELSRGQMLTYCANIYQSKYNRVSPELLANLQSSESAFLTFVTGQNFVCLGVKQSADAPWKSYVCDGKSKCLLADYGQVTIFDLEAKGKLSGFRKSDQSVIYGVATGIDNTEVGLALKEYNHRVALLHYIRLFANNMGTFDTTFRDIPSSQIARSVPQDFCGQVDEHDAGLVRKLQASLNANGIDVGKPDGSLGPNTRKGIRASNNTLLSRNTETVDTVLLKALGMPQQDIATHVFCQ